MGLHLDFYSGLQFYLTLEGLFEGLSLFGLTWPLSFVWGLSVGLTNGNKCF